MAKTRITLLSLADDVSSPLQPCLHLLQQQESIVTHHLIERQQTSHEIAQIGLSQPVDVVVIALDDSSPGPVESLTELIAAIASPSRSAIAVGPNDAEVAVAAIKAGARDYLSLDRLTPERLSAAIANVTISPAPSHPSGETAADHNGLVQSHVPEAPKHSPLRDEVNQVLAVDVVLQEVVRYQQIEQQLRESQHFIHQVAEAVPGILYVYDLVEQRNIYVNRQIASLLGYTEADIQAMGADILPTLMHPEDLAHINDHLAYIRSIQDGEISELEYRMRHAQGGFRWFYTREVVFRRTDDGQVREILGISQDITDRKRTQAALQQKEIRFQLIADTIQDVFWISDLRTSQIIYVSPAYEAIWGRPAADLYQDYSAWEATIHPEDRARVLSMASASVNASDQDPIEQEYRIIRPDGSIRWIRDRGFLVRDSAGQVQQTVGIAQDITERKQAEAAIADNEARLQGFVDANVIGILFINADGNFFGANEEFLRITGYTHEEIEAGDVLWIDVTPAEYLPLDEKRIAEAREKGACTPYEKEYIRKDGKRVPVLVGFSRVGQAQEEWVVFVLDLSRHKRTERHLRRSEDRLRMVLESAQLGTWDWNLITDTLVWDARCKAMFGLPPEAPITIETFYEHLHPDDHERLKQAIARALNPTSGGKYDIEYRLTGVGDGVEHWILAKGQAYFESDGTPRRFIGTVLDVTDRKRTEEAIRESEERLQMAIEGSGVGFWDWNIITNEDYLSPQWLEMLGYEDGELPEKYSSWEKLIHPDDKSMVMETLYAHLKDNSVPYKFEYRLLTKLGDYKWIANYGKVVVRGEDGSPIRMAGIHHDISDRRQAEEQLRISEQRYRTLANAVSQLMWVNDASGNLEFVNQQWKDYTGIDDITPGISLLANVIHPDDVRSTHETRTQAIETKQSYETECRLKRYDQVYRWHLARILPLKDDAGNVINWFGTATDIHDRKCAEAEREQLLEREKAAREAAERANRIKDEFLAILSHELRSPLNPIMGWAKLLQTRQMSPEKTAHALSTIERNAKLQTQLIDDLLDVAKILRGKLQLQNARVALHTIVDAAVETVSIAATAKSITLLTDSSDIGQVWGDAARMQQIVWNLLSNAIKFTPEGGQVTVQLQQRGGRGQITVQDTGRGIHRDFLPYIFESFRQEDISITRQHGGLGLGLAIARYLVEAHGGTISADSKGEGDGATFTVTLPLIKPSDGQKDLEPSSLKGQDLQDVRVLVIDDELDSRDLLQEVLTYYGAEVMIFASATDALTSFKRFRPDVIISDLGMPHIDGYAFLRQVRAMSSSDRTVPAIALTAYARKEDQQQALESGFQAHLSKPTDVDDLILTILKLVRLPTQK